MRVYRPRGVALNYEFFRRNLSDSIPYIYVTINPTDWLSDPAGGYYCSTAENPLNGLGSIIYILLDNSTGLEYYASLTIELAALKVYVTQIPTISLDFLAFPKDRVKTAQLTIQSTDLSLAGTYYSTTVDLSGYPTPLLVTFDSGGTPVYFDTLLSGNQLTLNASQLPTFDTTLTIYHL